MSGIEDQVFEIVNEMVQRVVEEEEEDVVRQVVADLVGDVVDREELEEWLGNLRREPTEEEVEWNGDVQGVTDLEEENEQEWLEQVGGASLQVLRSREVKAKGHFRNSVTVATLDLEIPRSMMADPNGEELFADSVIELIHRNAPAAGSQTRMKVGVIFESPEMTTSVGIAFKYMDKIDQRDVVQNLEDMSQSNKSPLELDVPKMTMQITYLHPPSGSGQKRMRLEKLMEAIISEKRRRGLLPEEEDFEALHNNEESMEGPSGGEFLDGEAREVEEEEEEEEEEGEQKSRVVMRNAVSKDCLPHAVYQSLMYRLYRNDRSVKNKKAYMASLRKTDSETRYTKVHEAVRAMKKRAGLEDMSENFTDEHINQIQQRCFPGLYQIIVFMDTSTKPYYKGPVDLGEDKKIYLLLQDGHYCGLQSVPALFNMKYYCDLCETGYRNWEAHYNCPKRHRLCGAEGCSPQETDLAITCLACRITFPSKECFDNHKRKGVQEGKSRCDHTKYCSSCDSPYYRNKNARPHSCGEKYCHRCQCPRAVNHHCSMMPTVKNEKKLTHRRIYYDIESKAEPETGLQVPVMFIAWKCCKECSSGIPDQMEAAKEMVCEKCSPDGRLKIIESVTPENRFVDVAFEMTKWLFSKGNNGAVAVAHNASGYDGQFILEKLIASNKAAPSLSLDGTKLVFLKNKGVRLLDSLKYLTMSLGNVGKTFQIATVKGDFPVKFIAEENYDYEGPLPANDFYAMENKKPSDKKKLEAFLESERAAGKTFNFLEELHAYCFDDVMILAKAMTDFETNFEAMTNVCLLEESVTAASAAVQVFRRNHLQKVAPIVLDAKPACSVNASVLSQKYLAWLGHKENVQVDISTTYGEKKVGVYRVDGFIDKCPEYPEGQIIDFRGCYYHGHSCTFAEEAVIGEDTVQQIRLRDQKRVEELEKEHPVKIVWECDVMEELRVNKEMTEFFESYEPMDLLHCERALVGGRTEVFRLYANDEGQSLHYLDVVSLYPTVMKHEPFPIGPPSDVKRSDIPTPLTCSDDITFMGFLSCRVSPPRNLKLPLLPGKVGNRLMFFLCRKCAKEGNQHSCRHSDEERSFNGTFTTFELQKALDLGYVVTEVYHGVRYMHWLENDDNHEGGLFTSYINRMMEEKIYSSGWPSDVKSESEKDAYIAEYKEKEHIDISDKSRFSKNPGKRAVAKLMLNSLWGKFAQRVDRIQTEVVTKPSRFWRLVHDTTLSIMDVRPVNDTLVLKFRKQVETLTSLKTSAVHIAALVTSFARLRLYRLMEMVGGDNIVYTDTDSIVFAVPDGEENPLAGEVGPYLGQLTNETKGTMKEFVSTGPKSYCYRDQMKDGSEVVVRKAKGVTLNSDVDKKITFEAMKRMVDEVLSGDSGRSVEEVHQFTMRRDKEHHVYSVNMKKQFKFTFNKRRVLSDGSTLPFGYC